MIMTYSGELAALLTALCWSLSAIYFTKASHQIGSVNLNRLRLLLSIIFLVLTHWLLYATPLPLTAGPQRWFWLGLSGIIGLTLGDTFLFQAYIWIGPRLTMLLKSLAPVISALLAWLFLAEDLTIGQMMGIGLTVGGISWVILEKNGSSNTGSTKTKNYLWGILFGIGTAACQSIGLITAKMGLGGDFPALSGHVIRMLTATAAIWSITLLQRQSRQTLIVFTDNKQAATNLTTGTVLGPFIGVWFAMAAVQWTHVGIASTLMALVPIYMLPIGYFVFKERLSRQAIAGTVIAVSGVGLLFLA
jgi:drug/metabolite transporter (DMT)-like permease